jgi:hypothetical protein
VVPPTLNSSAAAVTLETSLTTDDDGVATAALP